MSTECVHHFGHRDDIRNLLFFLSVKLTEQDVPPGDNTEASNRAIAERGFHWQDRLQRIERELVATAGGDASKGCLICESHRAHEEAASEWKKERCSVCEWSDVPMTVCPWDCGLFVCKNCEPVHRHPESRDYARWAAEIEADDPHGALLRAAAVSLQRLATANIASGSVERNLVGFVTHSTHVRGNEPAPWVVVLSREDARDTKDPEPAELPPAVAGHLPVVVDVEKNCRTYNLTLRGCIPHPDFILTF